MNSGKLLEVSDLRVSFFTPAGSLNPRMTAQEIVSEPLEIHGLTKTRAERRERVSRLLSMVGLDSGHAGRYPHEFSGGQQQRIGIARALAVNPEFVVCDEPVSALDVSIQAQIINMLEDIQQETGLAYLFISHDIPVVRHISRRIGVMYLGSLVELAASRELCAYPLHPYTKALLAASPCPTPKRPGSAGASSRKPKSPARSTCPQAAASPAPAPPQPPAAKRNSPLREAAAGHSVACHTV